MKVVFKNNLWIFAGIVIALSAGCNRLSGGERDNITFSHKFHITQGLECLNCHEGIVSSEAVGFGLPTMDTCAQCHFETQENDKCNKCHTNPSAAKKFTLRQINLNFSHKNHIERVNNDCTACHTTVASSERIKDDNIPVMNTCLNCHSGTVRELKCSQCHTNLGSYELKPITHFSHKGNFVREHQEFARADVSVCAQCHLESFCSDCHSRVEGVKPSIKFPESEGRTFIHRGDWLSRHPIEAKTDQGSCLKCHDTKQCRECHEENQAEPSRTEQGGHPQGWLTPGDANFHGKFARRDATLCAGCHEAGEKTICIECHKAGQGVNIHPSGFKSSLDKNKDKRCQYCH